MDEDRPTFPRRLLVSVWTVAVLQILAVVAAQDVYHLTGLQREIIGAVILIPPIAITLYLLLAGRYRKGE